MLKRFTQTLVTLFSLGILAALLIPFTVGANPNGPQTIEMTPGERLAVTCETELKGSVDGNEAFLECVDSQEPGVSVTELKGVEEGATLSGTVAIEALVKNENDERIRVAFEVTGPESVRHVEQHVPYFLKGDRNGEPIGWDTTTVPDGAYTLSVVAIGQEGSTEPFIVEFTVDNSGNPEPTAEPTQEPTAEPTTEPTREPTAEPTTPPTDMSVVQQVIALTNAEREAADCPALVVDDNLMAAAQGHSEDMAANNFMSHTGSNGSSPWDRMREAGYEYSRAAENVAAGYRTAESVVDGWMNSSGHRRNILNCGLTEIGVGYETNSDSDYGTYWTQKFGTPR
ncbi:MAG: CAP domain-containing protein [Chloroflexota bacterium]